ncbi:amidoligase family protein [Mesorhizobium sp. M0152]|uniref:amidoligase family protein n=1 Tax=Mesorhizobium sp. M0152 TaxID=2956898 RepID=UPI003335CB05
MPLSTRTFGIELEVIMPWGETRTTFAAKLRHYQPSLVIRPAAYGAPTSTTCWKIQPDSSTGFGGCELVSPILFGEHGIAEARRMCDALKAAGAKVNVSTGFHVHFGATGLDLKALKNLAKMYVWFESFFDHVMPKSRRATNNTYTKSNRADFGGYGTYAVNSSIVMIDAAPDLHAFLKVASPERRRKLNLTNLKAGGKGTIEFRQHSGTVDADKVENWVRLLDAFVTKALTTRIRKRTVTRDLEPVEEMRQLFDMIEADKPVRIYYMNRRKEIAKLEAAGLPMVA